MLKLNLGCGEDIREGYENIDIRDIPGCIKADVRNLPYNNVDEILASDIYEHISHRESLDLLKHWYDILKPGGFLVLRAPCLDTIVEYLLNTEDILQIEEGIRMIFGGQEYKENSHFTICQSALMLDYLKRVGFVNITYGFQAQNIIIQAYKGNILELLEMENYKFSNLVEDNPGAKL